MIQNAKLFTLITGTGGRAIKAKVWTKHGSYSALMPVPKEDLPKIKAAFSPIRHNFIGLDETDWQAFDDFAGQFLGKLSRHAVFALSLAVARASTDNDLWRICKTRSVFPRIAGTVVKGGDWAEFMVIPYRERDPLECYRKLAEVWKVIGEEMKGHGILSGRSQTGAWITDLSDPEFLQFLHDMGNDWDVKIGININAGRLWNGKAYNYSKSRGIVVKSLLKPAEQIDMITAIAEHFRLYYVEDPFQKADLLAYSQLTHKLESGIVAGNSLFDGDIERIKRGQKMRCASGVVLDPWKLETLVGLSGIADYTADKGISLVFSVQAGETEDSWLSDLAVAFGARLMKMGVVGAENTSKLNRLLEIWEEVASPRLQQL